MNEEQPHSTPQECIDKLDLIELYIRELVSTINSGQFADVRQRIAQLQNTTNQFKAEVQKLPDIKRSVPQQTGEIDLLKTQIQKQLAGIQVANVKSQLLLNEETEKSTMSSEVKPTQSVNEQIFRCVHCDSLILSKGVGKIVDDLSFDIPLPRQKKDFTVTEKEKLTLFCCVDRVHDFDNVGVTKSHEGIVYLACADCEIGPIGLQDKESGKYLIAIERSMVDCDLSVDLFPTDDENSPQKKKSSSVVKFGVSPFKQVLRNSIQLEDSDSELEIVDVKSSRETTPPRKPKREVTDFFVSRDPAKPKINLDSLVSKRPPKPTVNKSKKSQTKELKFNSKTGVLLSSIDLKPDPGQLSIESHLRWKDNRSISQKFIKKPKTRRITTPPPKSSVPDDSIFKTLSPSNRKFSRMRSSSPEFSPRRKFSSIAEEFKASLRSPTFLLRKKSSLKGVLEETKKMAKENPKSRNLKFAFPAIETEECRIQCDALGLEGKERKDFVEKVSRKRARSPEMPKTPEHYWEVDMPDYEEQKRRGMAALPNIDKVKKDYEEQLRKYQVVEKEREKIIGQRQQLEAQKTENELVKQELDVLQPGTNVFKLIGPALVKQDLEESKATVGKRLEYIEEEIKRCDKNLDASVKKIQTAKESVENSLKSVQAQLAKG
ncbi:hypothetical protein FO519_006713 [Halicephalobus sp. NKZ332]|nr:hypothetical protein FO519_006713 [Halicephalobus sp. NKZ332]